MTPKFWTLVSLFFVVFVIYLTILFWSRVSEWWWLAGVSEISGHFQDLNSRPERTGMQCISGGHWVSVSHFWSRRISICLVYFKSRCYFWLGCDSVCVHKANTCVLSHSLGRCSSAMLLCSSTSVRKFKMVISLSTTVVHLYLSTSFHLFMICGFQIRSWSLVFVHVFIHYSTVWGN